MCHRFRRWNEVGFWGQSGLRIRLSGKEHVAIGPKAEVCSLGPLPKIAYARVKSIGADHP
jgi:hypothetical protein